MQFKLAFIKSESQFLITEFIQNENSSTKTMDIIELSDSEPDAIIYPEIIKTSELLNQLEKEHKFCPVMNIENIPVKFDNFEQIDYQQAKDIFFKLQDNWILQNNLSLIEELFGVVDHLKELWPNDRTTFFEELWFIIRSNLGSKELKIIFNDLQPSDKKDNKNELIQTRIEGIRIPEPVSGSDLEKTLLEHYQGHFSERLSIVEYNEDNGEIVLTVTIKNSPVLIMTKINNINRLQKAVLSALFDGLQ